MIGKNCGSVPQFFLFFERPSMDATFRSPSFPAFPTLLPVPRHILCDVAKHPVSQSLLVGKTIGIMPLVLLSL
jgi:hypothetical protein